MNTNHVWYTKRYISRLLVLLVSDWTYLRHKRSDASPKERRSVPVDRHRTHPDALDDERERVDERSNVCDGISAPDTNMHHDAKHRRTHDPRRPTVVDLQLLVRHAHQNADKVDFGCEYPFPVSEFWHWIGGM